jgi:hypothetical protein
MFFLRGAMFGFEMFGFEIPPIVAYVIGILALCWGVIEYGRDLTGQ